ncbi:MAG: hypothetical protein HY551_04310 [Elusimicrobia bacterium]|nr:hypothetical protein [Elusimicrobiota bacterium]
MAKKNRKGGGGFPAPDGKYAPGAAGTLSALGKKLILVGLISVAGGFFVLSRTDPYGRNRASHLAPYLLLGGYGLIAAGLLAKNGETEGRSEAMKG